MCSVLVDCRIVSKGGCNNSRVALYSNEVEAPKDKSLHCFAWSVHMRFLRKHMKCVEALLTMIHVFPYHDPQSKGLLEDMQKIRTKFRQVSSQALSILNL